MGSRAQAWNLLGLNLANFQLKRHLPENAIDDDPKNLPTTKKLKSGNWVFPRIGVPQNGWFIMENPIKMDDLGGTNIFGNTQLFHLCTTGNQSPSSMCFNICRIILVSCPFQRSRNSSKSLMRGRKKE